MVIIAKEKQYCHANDLLVENRGTPLVLLHIISSIVLTPMVLDDEFVQSFVHETNLFHPFCCF